MSICYIIILEYYFGYYFFIGPYNVLILSENEIVLCCMATHHFNLLSTEYIEITSYILLREEL